MTTAKSQTREEAAFAAGFNATFDVNRWRFDNAPTDHRAAFTTWQISNKNASSSPSEFADPIDQNRVAEGWGWTRRDLPPGAAQ